MIQEKLLGAMSQVSNILTAANTAETAKQSAEASFAQRIASQYYSDPRVMGSDPGNPGISMIDWVREKEASGELSPKNYARYKTYMTAQSGIQFDELAASLQPSIYEGVKPAVSKAIQENPVVIQEKVREDQVGI